MKYLIRVKNKEAIVTKLSESENGPTRKEMIFRDGEGGWQER